MAEVVLLYKAARK